MSLDWENNSWDVPTRLVPAQLRGYVAALPPHSDDGWLPTTLLGSPAVLLGTASAAVISVPLPTYPTSRNIRAALDEMLRAVRPRFVAAVRVVRKIWPSPKS